MSSRSVVDVDDGFRREWQELAADAVEPNPFFAPEILIPAVRSLPGGTGVRLVTVRQDGELVLALPITRARYRRIPVPVLSTWRHPLCYVGTPLVRSRAMDSAPRAFLAALERLSPPGWLVLEQVYLDGPVTEAFHAAARDRAASWVEHNVLERPVVLKRAEETYLESTLSHRSAKTLRRLRRMLAREVGPVTTRNMVDAKRPAEIAAAVEAFLQLESAGWKGGTGTAVASHPAHASFWREACRDLAAVGRLELWQLTAADVLAACQVHVRYGGTVFHWKTTYNEALARTSPGVQLELDVLHAFHVDPSVRCLDPCTGADPSTSARLYPDRRRIGDVLIGFTPVGRLVARATPLAARGWRVMGHRVRRGRAGG